MESPAADIKHMVQNLLSTMQLVEGTAKLDDLTDGVIEVKSVAPFFAQLNVRISEDDLKALVKELDPSEKGVIRVTDFVARIEVYLKQYIDKEELLESFRVFDPERTGLLNVSKMRLILFKYGGMQSEETDELIFEMLDIKKPAVVDPATNIEYLKFADKLFEIA